MVIGLYTGLTTGFGRLEGVWAWIVNILLLAQFPLAHSGLLTRRGQRLLARLAPYGSTLATTTYATIASVQLLLLFTLWTPSGVVVWAAEGPVFWLMTMLYLLSWALLTKASFDAGPEVQSGALGWTSLARGVKPVFPDMPVSGLFRYVRQPIYVSFALTLWTPPVWTLDLLVVAVSYTAYCLFAPRLKERRFTRLFGDRFRAYQAKVPYWIPLPRRRRAG